MISGKQFKSLEESALLIEGVTEAIKNKAKEGARTLGAINR